MTTSETFRFEGETALSYRCWLRCLVQLSFTQVAGGWELFAVLPEYGIVGKPLHLTFMVRDPGLTPREDFTPAIAASSGTEVLRAGAAPTKKAGEYRAILVFP